MQVRPGHLMNVASLTSKLHGTSKVHYRLLECSIATSSQTDDEFTSGPNEGWRGGPVFSLGYYQGASGVDVSEHSHEQEPVILLDAGECFIACIRLGQNF